MATNYDGPIYPQFPGEDKDDIKEMQDIIQMYVAGLPASMKNMTDALGKQDWDALAILTHQLKGSGSSMGYPLLTEMARDIEANLTSQDYEKIPAQLADLLKIVDRLSWEIRPVS